MMHASKVSSIARLNPVPRTYEQAVRAFRLADFSMVIWNLNRTSDLSSAVLRARALLRLGRPDEAAFALSAAQGALDFASGSLKVEYLVVYALCQGRLNRFENARSALDACRVDALRSGDPLSEARYNYSESAFHFYIGDLESSVAYANAVLEASEDDPGRTNIYRVGLRDERARAYLLSAIVAAVAGRQSDCSQLLTSMFSESVGLAEIDRELYSKLLLLLAYRVRDFAAEVDSEFWKSP